MGTGEEGAGISGTAASSTPGAAALMTLTAAFGETAAAAGHASASLTQNMQQLQAVALQAASVATHGAIDLHAIAPETYLNRAQLLSRALYEQLHAVESRQAKRAARMAARGGAGVSEAAGGSAAGGGGPGAYISEEEEEAAEEAEEATTTEAAQEAATSQPARKRARSGNGAAAGETQAAGEGKAEAHPARQFVEANY